MPEIGDKYYQGKYWWNICPEICDISETNIHRIYCSNDRQENQSNWALDSINWATVGLFEHIAQSVQAWVDFQWIEQKTQPIKRLSWQNIISWSIISDKWGIKNVPQIELTILWRSSIDTPPPMIFYQLPILTVCAITIVCASFPSMAWAKVIFIICALKCPHASPHKLMVLLDPSVWIPSYVQARCIFYELHLQE